MTDAVSEHVAASRETIKQIIGGDDHRFLAIVGPCSIHDEEAALEYATRLKVLAEKVSERIFVVMRVYFEKPRTTVGWKGLINDPHMDDSFDIDEGLHKARRILMRINELGLPAGTEMLEPIVPQYIADLVSWASIGARTTESPTHRQLASGLSMPVGYKNATDGSVDIAIHAMISARAPHSFLGIDNEGRTAIIKTRGNEAGHLILRGGRSGTNYDRESIVSACDKLLGSQLNPALVVDCSHANSEKDHTRQEIVWRDVIEQRANGLEAILGAMLESNINEGQQKLTDGGKDLQYGVSITDACIGWEKTEELLTWAHEALAPAMTGAHG